jgi:hypothetical protein
LRSLLVDAAGKGGTALSTAYLPTVETIDRPLTIRFDLPGIIQTGDAPSPFNETCGRSWSCPCLQYELEMIKGHY